MQSVTQRRLMALHASHIASYGIGHAAYSISNAMEDDNFSTLIVSSSIDTTLPTTNQKSCFSKYIKKIAYRSLSDTFIAKLTEKYFLAKLRQTDIVYLWPSCSLQLFEAVKSRGNLIIMETINCHQATSKMILETESKNFDIPLHHKITEQAIHDENKKLALCDYVFSPSPLVKQSLLDNGVAPQKIISSSYGLSNHQILMYDKHKDENDITAIFVGSVGMRKGIHLLLEYWLKANVNGTLKIIGNIENNFEPFIAQYRDKPGLEFISFVDDLDTIYKQADFFVLPSLEEGSPLVTYLALGAGLPCIVSPMAGAGVIEHNETGYIIEPHDETNWISSIKELARSKTQREIMHSKAKKHAKQFLWEHVGKKRSQLLSEQLKD